MSTFWLQECLLGLYIQENLVSCPNKIFSLSLMEVNLQDRIKGRLSFKILLRHSPLSMILNMKKARMRVTTRIWLRIGCVARAREVSSL